MATAPFIKTSRSLRLCAPPRRRGFTLIELLVVIGIIVVLIGILIPVVSAVKKSAKTAENQAFVNGLAAAIERYYNDFKAYPGPLSNDQIRRTDAGFVPVLNPLTDLAGAQSAGFSTAGLEAATFNATTKAKITMPENLVLGLLGGLKLMPAGEIEYDPRLVGHGAQSLNTASPGKKPVYLEGAPLSWRQTGAGRSGRYEDLVGPADDTIIPEIVDRFTDPLPILYLRAKVSGGGTGTTAVDNAIVTWSADGPLAVPRSGQYQLEQIIAYTGAYTTAMARDDASPPAANTRSIGVGKKVPEYHAGPSDGTTRLNPQPTAPYHGLRFVDTTGTMKLGVAGKMYCYPYDAFPYLSDPATANTARKKDAYILICAGADRVYGTNDDIANFGSVVP